MQGLSTSAELISWLPKDEQGYYTAQLAISGILSQPFSFHCSDIEGWSEERLGQFLERQAKAMIDRYGDARLGKQDEHVERELMASAVADGLLDSSYLH